MFKNHFKIAWRSLLKRKFHAIINIIGLTSSLVFIMLIAAYVWEVHHVNSDLRNKDQQYILQSDYKKSGIGIELTTIGALPKALKEEYPNLVANYYRLDGLTCIISNEEKIYEESVSLGDATLLEMFGFELLEGDAKTALVSPYSVVITEPMAIKYFGKKEALGETLTIRNFTGEKHDFIVTGILKSTKLNSVMELNPALRSSIFLPIASEQYFGREIDKWDNLWIAAFVELQKGVQPEELNIPIKTLVEKHADNLIAENLSVQLKPLSTYYLDDNKGAVRKLTHVLMWIGGFLLLMAVVNFINFTVSQSFTRLKEIGVRKILGSNKTQLILQLMTEYMMLVFVAGMLALFLYPLAVPFFESIISTSLPNLFALPFSFLVYFILLVFTIGLLSSIYPAVKLSQNNLSESLKNQLSNARQKHLVRQVLLFTQFTATIVVLIASVVISQQINIFLKSDLGYDKESLITVQVPRDWSETGLQKMERIRDELRELTYVDEISLSYGVPGSFGENVQQIQNYGSDDTVDALLIISDSHFSKTYNIPLLAGQFFNENDNLNKNNDKIVINKKTAKALGFNDVEEAIGKQVSLFNNRFHGIISGVTDDFYAKSLHSSSSSVMWFSVNNANQYRFFSIRLKAGSTGEALTALERKWKEILPNSPFEFNFIDDTMKSMYQIELQLQHASQLATAISIIILVLGLIGLTSLAINLRIKEIGIRKVLGASLRQIILLFSREFYMTFLLSVMISCPLIYMIMKKWIANYSIQTELSFEVFALPIIILIFLLIGIIGLVTIRAVSVNPVESLRDE